MRPDFEHPTELHLITSDSEVFEVKRREPSWWLGTAGLVFLITFFGFGSYQLARSIAEHDLNSALLDTIGTSIGVAFAALFASALTHQRLRVTRETVQWSLRLLSWTLRQKSMALDEITALDIEDRGGEEHVSWYLQLKSANGTISFGGEPSFKNMDRLRGLIERRRRRSKR